MSKANVEYIIKHNPDIELFKIEIYPNTIEPINISCNEREKVKIRNKYGILLANYKKMRTLRMNYMLKYYSSNISYEIIISRVGESR